MLLAALLLLFSSHTVTVTVSGQVGPAATQLANPMVYQHDGHVAARAPVTVQKFDPGLGVLDSVKLTYTIPSQWAGSTASTAWAWENLSPAAVTGGVHYASRLWMYHCWAEPTQAWPIGEQPFTRAEFDWFVGWNQVGGTAAYDGSTDCAGASGAHEERWWQHYAGGTPLEGARTVTLQATPDVASHLVGQGVAVWWVAPRLLPYDGADFWNDPFNGHTLWHGQHRDHHDASLVLGPIVQVEYSYHDAPTVCDQWRARIVNNSGRTLYAGESYRDPEQGTVYAEETIPAGETGWFYAP